jgi:putative hemolysin
MPATAKPFELAFPLQKVPALGFILNSAASKMLALGPLDDVYRQLLDCPDIASFVDKSLVVLQVTAELEHTALQRIPQTGAAIVVANHPYGGIEGLMLISLLLKRRPDVRLLANHLLWRIPELREVLIPVDVLDPRRKSANIAGLRAALAHVKAGGLLATFPAGAVSHLQWPNAQIVDPAWSATAARLIRKCNAPVTPLHFAGHNGLSFQVAGLIHPLLRTALLPRELVNKRERQIAVTIGMPIPAAQIQAVTDDAALASLLRLQTYGLAKMHEKSRAYSQADMNGVAELTPKFNSETLTAHATQAPIAAALPADLIAAELAALPASQHLIETSGLQVVYAHAAQLPWTLQELGRLRELTFRAVGEGTGRTTDIDLFDNYYTQLICWNPKTREVVGGYRLGAVDQILPRYGLKGLYTHTLFKYGRELPKRLGAALELGRSFVRPEYQRSFAPLLALWKGISEYVARHPHYRVLFGPVSISNDYLPSSRVLLVEFLKRHCFDAELSKLIKPRTPLRRRHPLASLGKDFAQLPDLDTLSDMLTQLEPDHKGVPVLLRQYLKLGGKLLGFNVDAQFGHAIDGLIMVDLPSTELKTLQRYMGKEAAVRYLAGHQPAETQMNGS